MESEVIGKVSFDYYLKSPSYIKMIVDMLPDSKASIEKKYIIRELYNYYMNHTNEEKISEITKISSLFREKVAITDLNTIARQVDYLYSNFLNRIIFDSINRGKIFEIMNECVKVFVGYYDLENTKMFNEKENYLHINR